jgi:hypothetical protein
MEVEMHPEGRAPEAGAACIDPVKGFPGQPSDKNRGPVSAGSAQPCLHREFIYPQPVDKSGKPAWTNYSLHLHKFRVHDAVSINTGNYNDSLSLLVRLD